MRARELGKKGALFESKSIKSARARESGWTGKGVHEVVVVGCSLQGTQYMSGEVTKNCGSECVCCA